MKTLSEKVIACGIAALALTLGAGLDRADAEEPIASELDVSNYRDYIGTWLVTIEVMGQQMELFLNIADVDGKVGATLDSANSPEPLAIAEILELEGGGLDMASELKFGGSFTINIELDVKLEGDVLTGNIKDTGGIFSSPIAGTQATQEQLDSVQGRRPNPTEARLRLNGQLIRIAFADLEMGTSDWDLFQQVSDGEVYEFTLSRATKLYTDMDLKFGDVVIKKDNMAKDYPGVYSMWLKKVGNGWNLVFNNQPDIWGTRHLSEHDVAEVPLNVSKIEGEPQEAFVVKLEGDGNGGAIRMLWGETQWSADFAVVQ